MSSRVQLQVIVGWIVCGLLSGVVFAAQPADFATATRKPYQEPEKKSINGKSLADVKAAVEKLWDTYQFEVDGKPVKYSAVLETDAGEIEIEFWDDVAPNHCRSFLGLSEAGFFDGLIFHRCIPGFVIQGGCPLGTGTGGPGYCVKPEFNDRPHVRGVLSMARAQPKDSAGSQFFICVDRTPSLDKQYTAFGMVTKGMEVVDKIVNAPTGAQDRPLKPVTIRGVKVSKQ